ncbi:TPA: hypothetical protein ACP41B_000997 [Enterobacter cloacae]|uniref:hypothetical protein n=1 Tax=Enterobacter hormaechei TaxID=158836 RepID=UPI002DB7EF2E|nr:hypothetical protein [Enterobacter hormaechei]MEB7375016.1 hypothetical protein [Enterobacter hormaechei]
MGKYIISLMPIIISFLALVVNFIHGSNRNKTVIFDTLSKEMSAKKPNPYVVQACISRIHSSRPIPFSILKRLLSHENSFEIIQLFSFGRKILDIFKLYESNGKIIVDYSMAYKSKKNLWASGLLCLAVMLFLYYLSVTTLLDLMMSIDFMIVRDSRMLSTWIGIIPEMCILIFCLLLNFIFSWQFQIICSSKKRIKKIQKLLDEGRASKTRLQ